MSIVDQWNSIKGTMDEALATLRVVPVAPKGKKPKLRGVDDLAGGRARTDCSSWSLFVTYEDASGELSERRITCRRIDHGLGGMPIVQAFCHEREAPRAFRVDRMREIVDLSTGEVVDPFNHFELLKRQGLPVEDKGMATFSKMLVFMSLCDGEAHASEWREIDQSLITYAVRFGGDDSSLEKATTACRGLAPDGKDFTNCLGTLLRSPAETRRQVARLAIDSCARVIDADGRHTEEELHWGAAIGSTLKKLATS